MKEKHAPASRAILKAMRVRRYNAERIAQYGMPLNTAIGPVFTPYCPSGRHGHRFRRKKIEL